MWYKILKLINHLTPDSAQSWYPYDVACNLIRMTDDTRIHEDGNRNEDEWTFLLYVFSLSLARPLYRVLIFSLGI